MKYVVTPEFAEKLNALDAEGRSSIGKVLKIIESADKSISISGQFDLGGVTVTSMGNDVLLLALDKLKIFCSIGRTEVANIFYCWT